jgi:hypothetical protein
MDTVRIWFLGEMHGISCCAYDFGNAYMYGMPKERV